MEKPISEGVSAKRLFQEPDDAIAFYSDFTQVIATGNEILLQFYESIPGLPTEKGIETVNTRLKATVSLSNAHATNIGKLLLEKIESKKQ